MRVVRLHLPQWRGSQFDPWEEAAGEWHAVLLLLPFAVVSTGSRAHCSRYWSRSRSRWCSAVGGPAMPSSSYADAGERPRLVVCLMR